MSDAPPVQVSEEAMSGKGVKVMPDKVGGYSLSTASPVGARRRSKKAGRRSRRRGGADDMDGARRRRKTAGRRSRRRGGAEEMDGARRRRY